MMLLFTWRGHFLTRARACLPRRDLRGADPCRASRRSVALLAALAAIFLPLTAAEQDDIVYRALVQRAKSGDRTVDYRLMRLTCMKSSLCQPRGSRPDLAALNAATKDHQLQKAVEIGERLIDEGFVNVEVHATLVKVYADLHDTEKSNFHLDMVAGMLRSIMSSGDGKTKETAYEVICDREQYDLLTTLGLPYSGDSIISAQTNTEGAHTYSRWEVRNPKTGMTEVIFFNKDAFVPEKSLPRD
jgi:Domain of unknown function (DUF4919)